MSKESYDPRINDFILQVVHKGSTYQIDEMEKLYASDQSILFLTQDGSIGRSSRAEMLAEFTSRRDAGEPHLSTEHRVLHIERQGDLAVALLYRRMSTQSAPFLYKLRLRKAGGWLVSGETVTPWTDPAIAGAFLPPRQKSVS
jgi:hypothetical protein